MTSNIENSSASISITREKLREELDAVLGEAKKEAFNSRDATHMALAKGYVWYQRALNLGESERTGREYLRVKFENHSTPIAKKAGVSDYNPVVKLIFDMTAPKYAPTVPVPGRTSVSVQL